MRASYLHGTQKFSMQLLLKKEGLNLSTLCIPHANQNPVAASLQSAMFSFAPPQTAPSPSPQQHYKAPIPG